MMIFGTLTLIGVVTVPLVIFKKWKALGIFLIVVCGIGLGPTLVDLFWYDVPLSAELGRIAIIASTFVSSGIAFYKNQGEKK
jgi:hypothetical protein